jgi:glucose 1-dehydrogenase
LAAEIRAAGGAAITAQADVANESQVVAMFDAAARAFGTLDIVVANAGIQSDAPLETMQLSQWNAVIAANLTGQFLCAREAARRFLAQPPGPSPARGKIVCMSSVHEVIPWAGHVNYTASKGGVHMMMRSLAQELAPKGIRVNAIAPGAIRTPINRPAWSTPEALGKLLELIPYGRIGEPHDIAKAAVWLASDESDYVTGATLFVDGGMSLYPGFAANG